MRTPNPRTLLVAFLGSTACLAVATTADATEPCGDFGECRVLVEINASDGDIGFHWLADGDDLVSNEIRDPEGQRIFANAAFGPLRAQRLTETFGESAEPACRAALVEEPGDTVVTLAQFVRRWPAGSYAFLGSGADGAALHGRTALTHWLPAAPRRLTFSRGVITWEPGAGLGVCATPAQLWTLVAAGILPIHPMNVPVKAWEVTLELEDGSHRSFSTRLPARGPAAQLSLTVPAEFLDSVGFDTPAKIEVGAIGGRLEIGDDDNATFTELGGLCLRRNRGCADPE